MKQPFITRLNPSPGHPNFIVLRTLVAQMRREIGRHLEPGAAVLDLGCGSRPYESLFAPYARRYVGVDARPGPGVDVVVEGADLPFSDAEFDCVLCSQVLEHVPDPRAVVAEIRRVLPPGGLALISTHGVIRYHPNPEDYWRWTHAGLERLVRLSGDWRRVEVHPNGGLGSALAYVIGAEVREAATRARMPFLSEAVVLPMNAAAWRFDLADLRRRRGRPPGLAPNYLVSASA